MFYKFQSTADILCTQMSFKRAALLQKPCRSQESAYYVGM